MKISEVREELIDYLSVLRRNSMEPWLIEALNSWCQSVFLGIAKFKYWDKNKNKNEVEVSIEVLRVLISPYKEFNKFIVWLDRNFD